MSFKKRKVIRTRKNFQKDGIRWSATAFHPLMFERNVYAVSFYQVGKPKLDRFTKFTQVKARNGAEAIEKARKVMFK